MRSRNPRNVVLSEGVTGQHLIGQRQTFRRHYQSNDDLHTIRPVIARVAEAAFVAFRKWRIRLEIGAREVVEQHVVADVEQIAPPPRQVIKDRLFVRQQSVVTAVQFVDLGQPCVLAQQIGQGTAPKPLAVQPPFAARRQQAIGNQHKQDPIPVRPLTAHAQPLRPEQIELQFAPQQQRQPACAPLPWPAQLQLRQLDVDDRGVRQHSGAAVFRKQRQRPRLWGAFLEHLDRPPPRQLLGVVDLTQVQHVPLHHAPPGDPRVLDNAPVAVLLAILPANLATQEHDGRRLSAHWRP
jgi:hypothetical protein